MTGDIVQSVCDHAECHVSDDAGTDLFGMSLAPPSSRKLARARRQRMYERRMWSAIKEIVSYVLFLAIVSFIAWGTKNDTVYRMNAAIGALYKGANDTYNATNVSSSVLCLRL